MDWHIVYAKFDGCKGFKAFDVNEGRQVGNLIYASLMENTEDTRQKLQKLNFQTVWQSKRLKTKSTKGSWKNMRL